MPEFDKSHRLAHWVHVGLLAGVVLSGATMAGGLALALAEGRLGDGNQATGSLRGLFDRALNGSSAGLMELGLLVLIFTPVLRVAMLVVGWAIARQFRFAATALVVLALLLLSMWLGLG
jgi:uncharacterized membrane protein